MCTECGPASPAPSLSLSPPWQHPSLHPWNGPCLHPHSSSGPPHCPDSMLIPTPKGKHGYIHPGTDTAFPQLPISRKVSMKLSKHSGKWGLVLVFLVFSFFSLSFPRGVCNPNTARQAQEWSQIQWDKELGMPRRPNHSCATNPDPLQDGMSSRRAKEVLGSKVQPPLSSLKQRFPSTTPTAVELFFPLFFSLFVWMPYAVVVVLMCTCVCLCTV